MLYKISPRRLCDLVQNHILQDAQLVLVVIRFGLEHSNHHGHLLSRRGEHTDGNIARTHMAFAAVLIAPVACQLTGTSSGAWTRLSKQLYWT